MEGVAWDPWLTALLTRLIPVLSRLLPLLLPRLRLELCTDELWDRLEPLEDEASDLLERRPDDLATERSSCVGFIAPL